MGFLDALADAATNVVKTGVDAVTPNNDKSKSDSDKDFDNQGKNNGSKK